MLAFIIAFAFAVGQVCLTEQLVFPEISYEKIDKIRGLGIVIVTSAKSDEDAKLVLEKLGMPFKK